MSDFFVVVELIKYYDLDSDLLMYNNSFTYKTKVRTDTILDSYFTTLYGAIDNTGKETLNIKGLIVDINNFYSVQTSETDCEDNEKSFYFDIADQMFYIHFDHLISPYDASIEIGKVFGFTNDKVRNFNDIDYLPEILSIPNFSLKVDPLRYTQQSFYGGDVVFKNVPIDGGSNDGAFDSNAEFTGNDIFIYFGEDGDAYTDLLLIANNYIDNTIISMTQVIVKTKDKREQQSKFAPLDTFNDTDFPDIHADLIGQIKPDAYGVLVGVPGICINTEQAGNKTFYFASVITWILSFIIKKDGLWEVIVPSATDYPNGMATFAVADIHIDGDNTKGLYELKCAGGTYRPTFVTTADIIVDLNLRFLDVAYNSSNYNIVEWADEKQYLDNTGLYMGKEKEIFEWIEILQNASRVGFQYLFVNGKRTIRLDNPNRNSVKTVYAQEILNDLQFNNNEDFFATHAVILYGKDHESGILKRFKNMDYYNSVISEHRKDSQFETETLLLSEANADDKSVIIMEDLQKERPTGFLVLHGKEFFELQLFDIINAELSYPGQKIEDEINDVWIDGEIGDDTYIETDGTGIDIYIEVDYTRRDIIINYREFLGWMRFQIIGLLPDFDSGNMEVEVRQRDYSDLFDSITGYTP